MKLNKKQKRTIIISSILILISLIVWQSFGGEIFTKTEILIEKNDEMLGTSYKEWKDQFVLGLDYTLTFIGLVVSVTVLFLWRLKTSTK
ncbi:MAG: hypothetical protein K8F36_14480 [Melioribacteraceae bacterium]|nr:hypothetical protein [Melioribacteraceae bacterium]